LAGKFVLPNKKFFFSKGGKFAVCATTLNKIFFGFFFVGGGHSRKNSKWPPPMFQRFKTDHHHTWHKGPHWAPTCKIIEKVTEQILSKCHSSPKITEIESKWPPFREKQQIQNFEKVPSSIWPMGHSVKIIAKLVQPKKRK
jgi:hypothetical protein